MGQGIHSQSLPVSLSVSLSFEGHPTTRDLGSSHCLSLSLSVSGSDRDGIETDPIQKKKKKGDQPCTTKRKKTETTKARTGSRARARIRKGKKRLVKRERGRDPSMTHSTTFELPPRITTDGRAAGVFLTERMDGSLSLTSMDGDRSEKNRRKEIGAKKGAHEERNERDLCGILSFEHHFV